MHLPRFLSALPLSFVLLCAAVCRAQQPNSTIVAQLATPLDFQHSSVTGYTRQHWLEINERLLAGILPYFDASEGVFHLPPPSGERAFNALVDAPDGPDTNHQAFERIMMLAVIYSAATGRDTIPGYSGSITEPFRRGMIAALDPQSPHRWPKPAKGEHAGSIFAMGALLSPQFFWEPFTPQQRSWILDYLSDLGEARSYDNNHYYFHLVAVPLLEREGREAHRALHTDRLERLFGWYRGDGWFLDGSNMTFDKYNAWGFQLYNQVVYRLDPAWRTQFGPRIAQSSRAYLESYRYLVGRDGAPIAWGRSLLYRFAELAAVGWASLNGLTPLPPGEARRLSSGVLKYFWENHAQDSDGLLQVGYRATNGSVAEPYNGPGTTYWAAQGLIALLMPEKDPFWTAPELPIPADLSADETKVIAGARMVARVRQDGDARLYPVSQPFSRAHDHWQRGVKYQQHAYSSSLGWCTLGEGTDLGAGRTGISLDGKTWRYRDHARALSIAEHHFASAWGFDVNLSYQPAIDDRYEVITHTLTTPKGELHVFWHQNAQPVYLYLGGYGIASPTKDAVQTKTSQNSIALTTPQFYSTLRVIRSPEGTVAHEVLEPRENWRFAHLFDRVGTFPSWTSHSPVPANTPVAIYVDGGRGANAREPRIELTQTPGSLVIDIDGEKTSIATPW